MKSIVISEKMTIIKELQTEMTLLDQIDKIDKGISS